MIAKSKSIAIARFRPMLLATLGTVLAGLAVAYASTSDAPGQQNGAQQRHFAVRRSRIFYDVHRFHRVSFIVDTSGDMMNKFWSVSSELRQVVDSLSPSQSFDISYFGATDDTLTKYARCERPELLPATAESKLKARQFLQGLCTTGYRDPTDALESAFGRKSDVVYLLTDGDFSDNDAMLRRIHELNRQKRVKIYTIAFVGKTDAGTADLKLLKSIAAENRGRFRYVREWELQ